ncbi:hypothetical protein [Gemmata sp. SH-PL17]|uniref:hypothetical protein n=1 Tax=Gemmata sp. SH-PL17 TaxID=1630693 RepID=UPI0012F89610|nr:hypothetical protein [Gemmata sp. SH-PL17]
MMALDLSGDWALIDDPITVTYEARLTENTYSAPTSVEYAQRNDVTKEDLDALSAFISKGLLQKDATVFHLWTAKLNGTVPAVKDRVTYAGEKWTVQIVGIRDRDASGPQRYRLVCSKFQG